MIVTLAMIGLVMSTIGPMLATICPGVLVVELSELVVAHSLEGVTQHI